MYVFTQQMTLPYDPIWSMYITHTHIRTLTVYSVTLCPPSVRSVMFTRNADRLRAIALTLSMMGTGGTRWGHIDHSYDKIEKQHI